MVSFLVRFLERGKGDCRLCEAALGDLDNISFHLMKRFCFVAGFYILLIGDQ